MNKKKSYFKLIVVILLTVSLGCNAFLMYKVLFNNSSTVITNNTNTSTKTVNIDVKSSLTEVVAQAQESTVGVAVYKGNRPAGSGSGIIYKTSGNTTYVITNHHVIEKADSIEVIFSNSKTAKATLVGSDAYGDIAVLKMNTDFKVKPYSIGDSSKLDAGETVLAIGSPLGIEYAGTVTQGIVSGVSRTVSVDLNSDGSEDWEMNVIQTDAAINPGNSGGALINAVGELVGIVNMKFASETVEGIGFAIPVNDATSLADEIISSGKVSRPTLGIYGISLDSYSSYQLYIYRMRSNLDSGIYVYEVQAGSAADRAGLEAGDVITKFDDKEMTTYKDFLTALYSHKSNDRIILTVYHNNNYKNLTVTLG